MTFALVTCSGVSNTGKLTTQVALMLLSKSPGRVTWVQAQKGEQAIADAAEDADRVIVLEGCSDHCAMKKAGMAGIQPDIHIVATDLGIVKDGMADVRHEDVAKVLAALEKEQ
jgi:uncharacterized metal-binding protein